MSINAKIKEVDGYITQDKRIEPKKVIIRYLQNNKNEALGLECQGTIITVDFKLIEEICRRKND